MSSIQTQENEFTREVVSRLTSLRFRWLGVNFLTALVSVFALLGIFWFIVALIDYHFELAHGVRQYIAMVSWLVAVIGASALVGIVARNGGLKDLIRLLESRFSDFGQRLRTVLDIHDGRFNAPIPMQRVLGNQTLARWETSAPNRMIPYNKMWPRLALAMTLFGFLVLSLGMGNQWSTALRRSLGADIPFTVLTVEPGNTEVLEGTEVSLGLKLEGRLGRKVAGKWRKVGGQVNAEAKTNWIENALDPIEQSNSENIAKYTLALGKLKESVDYRFETSIGVSEMFRIKVRPLVQVAEVKTTVVPPAYTKASTRVFNENEVTALSGSEVTVRWVMTQPLSQFAVKIDDRNSPRNSVDANPTDDPRIWELVFPSNRTLNWQTQGVGVDGTPLEIAKGKLRIREDAAPHISWKKGAESSEVHTLAEVPLQISVSDDFAVASAQIILQFADGDERILAELTPDQLSDSSRVDFASILPLETLGLTQRDYLGFYAVARDNCEPNPRTTSTDVRFIDIRPLRQKYREVEGMPSEGGRTFDSLSELMRRQRLLINQTRRLTKLPAKALVDQIQNIDKLVQSQSELAGSVVFLAEQLLQRGNDDVESLRLAEAAMLQAADSLAAGTFETALLQEQDALRWLVETRNLLELILLKNPQMRRQINVALSNLNARLRRMRPLTALDIAAKLEQVAIEQKKLSNEVISQDKEAEETVDELLDRQSQIVQSVSDISDQVAKQTWPSKLIAERIEGLVKAISEAEKLLKDQNSDEYQPQAESVSDQARELAAHIRALNPQDPLESLAALAALSQRASKMESECVACAALGATGATNSSNNSGKGDLGRMARRIAARAETIEDILENLKASGNKEATEAVGQLESWIKQTEFLKTLAESKEAAAMIDAGSQDPSASKDKQGVDDRNSEKRREEANQRSTEYAAAAEFMNELYKRLASPRLEQLRKLEAKARQLQEAMKVGNGRNGSTESTTESASALTDSEVKAEMRELQEQLQRAGLEKIEELLGEQIAQGNGSMNYRGLGVVSSGIGGVVHALRLEIQAIIMEKISADRNIPVPPNYVEAVNRYFESIASPIEEGALQQ